jgi:hypothetical protein
MEETGLHSRSDFTLREQIGAPGATRLDRQLLTKDAIISGNGFSAEVQKAMDRRIEYLAREGLARRQGQRAIFARDLLETLRRRDLGGAAHRIAAETGLPYRSSAKGEHVGGIYRHGLGL